MSCTAPPDAFLEARLAGALNEVLAWHAADMDCEGMRRPDGQGLRVTFRGTQGKERLTLVFGVPRLPEGSDGRAVPVNVTLIREGGAMYSTRGTDRCVLDTVHQDSIQSAAAEPGPGKPLPPEAASRHWRIEAHGFCLEPARSVGDGRDAILLSTFDFRGQLTWEPDPPAPPPPPATTRTAP